MLRRKKKRPVVPVQNAFKELALPFEGRRMLIRTEDIQDSPTFDTANEDLSGDFCEPDLICPFSSNRYLNNKITCCNEDRHWRGEDKSFIPISNEQPDCTGVSRKYMDRYSSFVEFSDTRTTCPSKPKSDVCFRKNPAMNPRLQKNGTCTMYKVTKDYSGDSAGSYRIHTSTSCSDGNIHNHTEETKHIQARGQAIYQVKHGLNDDTNSLSSGQADNDERCTKSNDVSHQQSPHDADVVQHYSPCFTNIPSKEDVAENTKWATRKSQTLQKIGNCGTKTETVNVLEDQTQNSSPIEGKSTQTYHVRREKHCAGGNSSEYSYVIRVNCQPRDDNSGGDLNKSGHALTKRRRGDITRMRPSLEEPSEHGRPSANKIPLAESESSSSIKLPYQVTDSQRANQTSDSCLLSTKETHQHTCSTPCSSKSRMAGRLIDHLERKESLQATGQTEISTCSDSPDPAGGSQRRDGASLRIIRAAKRHDEVSTRMARASPTPKAASHETEVISQRFDEDSPNIDRATQKREEVVATRLNGASQRSDPASRRKEGVSRRLNSTSPRNDGASRRLNATSPRNYRASRRSEVATQSIVGNWRDLIKTQYMKMNIQERTCSPEKTIPGSTPRMCFTDERPNLKLCKDLSHNAENEHLVSSDSNVDSDVSNNGEIDQVSENSLNDLALANVNENKKHTRGLHRSKLTTFHGMEHRRNGGSQVTNTGHNNYKTSVKLRTGTDNDARKDNDCHQKICEINNQHSCCLIQNKTTNKSRFVNSKLKTHKNKATSRGQCLENSQTSMTIKRVLKPGVVHLSECTRNPGHKSASMYTDSNKEHLVTDDNQEDGNICTTRPENPGYSIAFNKSRALNLKYITPDALPVQRNRPNQSRHPPSYSIRRRQYVLDKETEQRTKAALPLMEESPPLQQSPDMTTALQNENSNRMDAKSEGNAHSNCVCACPSHRLQSPLPRSRNKAEDKTGTSTLNELKEILEEARAYSLNESTHRDLNASAAHLSCADFMTDPSAGCSFLGQYLRSLWKHQILCDTRVIVGQEEFLVHKLVLAAYSSVFCPPTTRPEPTVSFCIPNSSSDAVREIFGYMYTSTMTLTDEILEEVINAATFMGVEEVIDIVKDILIHPTLDNMNLYNGIVRRLGLHISLLDQEEVYREAFGEMKNKVAFLNVTLDELECILMDPEVMVTTEIETIEVIVSWVEYNYLQRVSGLRTLLNHVSYECIPPNELVKLAGKYSHIFDTAAGNSFLCDAFKFHALNSGDGCTPLSPIEDAKVEFPVVREDGRVRYSDEIKPCPCDKDNNAQEETSRTKYKRGNDCGECRQISWTSQSPASPACVRTCVKSSMWDPESKEPVSAGPTSRGTFFRHSKSPSERNTRQSRCTSENTRQHEYIDRPKSDCSGRDKIDKNAEERPSASADKKGGKGRTSRVSFHSSTVEGSPDNPTAMKYVPPPESNVSRNNNAFDDAMLLLLNRANDFAPKTQKIRSPGNSRNASSNCLRCSSRISVKPKELLNEYSHHTEAHSKPGCLNETSGSSRKSCAASREIPKSTSVPNDYPKDESSLNNQIMISKQRNRVKSETETNERIGQPYSKVKSDTTLFLRKQVNQHSFGNVDDGQQTQKGDGQRYSSRDRDKICTRVMRKVKSACTAVGEPLVANHDRDVDKSRDKKVTEDSLILLGHDAEASAFRVYEPPPDQLG